MDIIPVCFKKSNPLVIIAQTEVKFWKTENNVSIDIYYFNILIQVGSTDIQTCSKYCIKTKTYFFREYWTKYFYFFKNMKKD